MTSGVLLGLTVLLVVAAVGCFAATFRRRDGMAGLVGLGIMLVAAAPAMAYATVADPA